jgi:hypothetical protein
MLCAVYCLLVVMRCSLSAASYLSATCPHWHYLSAICPHWHYLSAICPHWHFRTRRKGMRMLALRSGRGCLRYDLDAKTDSRQTYSRPTDIRQTADKQTGRQQTGRERDADAYARIWTLRSTNISARCSLWSASSSLTPAILTTIMKSNR